MSSAFGLSLQWRSMGNELYRKFKNQDLTPCIAKDKLQEVLNCYYKADDYAENDLEKSSAKKNVAVMSEKMMECLNNNSGSKTLIHFYSKQAIRYYFEADKFGRDRDDEWLISIDTSSLKCWLNIQDLLTEEDVEIRIRHYEFFVQFLLGNEIRSSAFHIIAECYFHLSVSKIADKNYKEALSYLANCYFPIQEGLKLARTPRGKKVLDTLEGDIQQQISIAESLQALEVADDLFSQMISNEEEINFDIIWDIIDKYRRVIILTREKEIELEAIASSRIGKIYHKVLKLENKAKSYFTRTLELATTLIPRTMFNEEWYRVAAEGLKGFQDEERMREDEENRLAREEIMNELKDELFDLKKKFEEGKVDFLKFLYKTHPPKNDKHVLGELPDQPEPAQLKKLYQKAVVHFHPDKIDISVHGKKWKVLSEEICKILTSQYESYKGC
ncbi:uncharacterized protein LOC126822039 [Patella vulgata]|uniref:uncharacterized protein LOC126822039 n=1 Tax=Patella vulgata TaxID=6465 RepID=UPI00217F98F8|nr:uncharacterized protein LOC126822039 [Patella vulgata]XP_050406723.1 uncharacterized protein LOC126822039 [Patella vulgata]XP_050406724.1 uncharacterized protein LOC126822039 [Patella vulgata]